MYETTIASIVRMRPPPDSDVDGALQNLAVALNHILSHLPSDLRSQDAYVKTSLRNAHIQYLAAMSKRHHTESGGTDLERLEVSDGQNPEESYINAETAFLLDKGLSGLGSKEADIIHALYFNSQTYKEAAECFGVSVSTIKRMERAAIRKLGQTLQ